MEFIFFFKSEMKGSLKVEANSFEEAESVFLEEFFPDQPGMQMNELSVEIDETETMLMNLRAS